MKTSQKGSAVVLLSIIIILLVVIVGVLIYFKNQPATQTVVVSPSQTETNTQTPIANSLSDQDNTPLSQSSSIFTSPAGGETWKMGETHTITWTTGLPYDNGCHSALVLQDSDGQTVGIITSSMSQGQTSFTWNTAEPLTNSACGTGATAVNISPGKYRIELNVEGDGGPNMPDITVTSNYFNVE